MIDTDGLPKQVRRTVRALAQHLGLDPVVTAPQDGTWLVAVATERVEITVTFARARSGQTGQTGSTLSVDGTPRELANNYTQLAWIFANPDGTRDLGPLPEAVPMEDAPRIVRDEFGLFARHLPPEYLRLGRNEGGQWVIAISMPQAEFRMRYQRKGKGWRTYTDLVLDGVDRTHEFAGDIKKIIAALLGSTADSPAAPPSTGSVAPSTRANSVEVRRATVIRT